ncbi:MAG: 3-oxoacyl-ACP synthase [Chlorobi bacterium]|nr:3-oxoacyl-ACP synthase [Chlorobiota bacterium]
MGKLFINKYCHIKNNKVFLDGKLVFSDDEVHDIKPFLKSVYRFLKPAYNKFFKMDEISKLAYLCSEYLLQDVDLSAFNKDDIAIVLSNSDSTSITDQNHQNSISKEGGFFPSPSIFVYTLPNIMIGEISIRHKLKGENAFFIVENFDAGLLTNHINNLYLTRKAKVFIAGWVNINNDSYEAFLFLLSPCGKKYNKGEIEKVYNQHKYI